MANQKVKFSINVDKFPDLLSKIEDLTRIDDVVKFKIDSDNIFIYSLVGDSAILAFKNYVLNTSDYFRFADSLSITLEIIITSSKKFVRSLSFLKGDKISAEISYKESDEGDIGHCRGLMFSDGKLKIKLEPGESSVVRDITKTQLDTRLSLKNRKWAFSLDKEEFSDVKRLSSINSDGKVLHLDLTDNKVVLSELNTWELEVSNSEYKNSSLVFNKTFLSSINDSDVIEFNVFETFILIKDDISNLMISFETSFEND